MSDGIGGVFKKVAEYIRSASEPTPSAKADLVKSDGYVRGSSGLGSGAADEAVHAIRSRKQKMDELNDEIGKSLRN
jgi:hypothetical protein